MNPDDIRKELQKLKDMKALPVIDKRLSKKEVRRMIDAEKIRKRRQKRRPNWSLDVAPKEIIVCMGMKDVVHFIRGTIKEGKIKTDDTSDENTFYIEGVFESKDHFIVDRRADKETMKEEK